jgi:hypothetical protein
MTGTSPISAGMNCSHCGWEVTIYPDDKIVTEARRRIQELEAQIQFLNSKAAQTGRFCLFMYPVSCTQTHISKLFLRLPNTADILGRPQRRSLPIMRMKSASYAPQYWNARKRKGNHLPKERRSHRLSPPTPLLLPHIPLFNTSKVNTPVCPHLPPSFPTAVALPIPPSYHLPPPHLRTTI